MPCGNCWRWPSRQHAVFAANYVVAVGVYQAGLSVPQNMAVTGYEDIELVE